MARKRGETMTPEEHRAHLEKVAFLDRCGYRQVEIAKKTGVSQPSISADLAIIHEAYEKLKLPGRNELLTQRLHQLLDVKNLAWRSYEKSLKPSNKRVVEESPEVPCMRCEAAGVLVDDKGECKTCPTCRGRKIVGGIEKITKTTEGQCGDPRFLKIIEDCIKAERELLGLDADKRVKIGVNGQVDVVNWDTILGTIPTGPIPDVVEQQIEQAAKPIEYVEQGMNGYRILVEKVKEEPPDTYTNGGSSDESPKHR